MTLENRGDNLLALPLPSMDNDRRQHYPITEQPHNQHGRQSHAGTLSLHEVQ
ncbi:MAG TPA: hypothetical protein PL033_04895 [Candidatus Brocadiia bacterium]|nr:hypothetical protein [Candidatus Brocadiia bacterium]